MNTLCSVSICGAHSEYQNNGLSGSVQHHRCFDTENYFQLLFKSIKKINNISDFDDLYSDNRHCILITLYMYMGDTQSGSWLRYFSTSRKVACSIPDGGNGFLTDLILPAAL